MIFLYILEKRVENDSTEMFPMKQFKNTRYVSLQYNVE